MTTAQAEDTELRDLVIEALEKNGSLAKIRALLRANIFLAFEDEYDNIKQNMTLDNILKLPEGVLCLSVVYEFLEFCNLKNTLFVYKSESRHGKQYNYEGRNMLSDKLRLFVRDNGNEPVLVTLLRNFLTSYSKKYSDLETEIRKSNNRRDDQNSTYIVHEESSSATSQSQSDNSSDEKNKLHLRLQLDNSDTDTSSDSMRDKRSSEYIPSEHIIQPENEIKSKSQFSAEPHSDVQTHSNQNILQNTGQAPKSSNSSSDSTSYLDLKSFNLREDKSFTGLQMDKSAQSTIPTQIISKQQPNIDLVNSNLSNKTSSASSKDDIGRNSGKSDKVSPLQSGKSEEVTEYSYDFSLSPNKNVSEKSEKSANEGSRIENVSKETPAESPHQISQSSQSSISISDVADLISEKSSSYSHPLNNENNLSDNEKSKVNSKMRRDNNNQIKTVSDDSGDFSESPIPSLSNLSLDVHSD